MTMLKKQKQEELIKNSLKQGLPARMQSIAGGVMVAGLSVCVLGMTGSMFLYSVPIFVEKLTCMRIADFGIQCFIAGVIIWSGFYFYDKLKAD